MVPSSGKVYDLAMLEQDWLPLVIPVPDYVFEGVAQFIANSLADLTLTVRVHALFIDTATITLNVGTRWVLLITDQTKAGLVAIKLALAWSPLSLMPPA